MVATLGLHARKNTLEGEIWDFVRASEKHLGWGWALALLLLVNVAPVTVGRQPVRGGVRVPRHGEDSLR